MKIGNKKKYTAIDELKKWIVEHTKDGVYISGIRVGIHVMRDKNGLIKEIRNYKNGKLEGKRLYFDPNTSRITKIQEYKNGIKNGDCIIYSENGKIKSMGKYLNGKKHGKYISFCYNGVIDMKIIYREGEIVKIFGDH